MTTATDEGGIGTATLTHLRRTAGCSPGAMLGVEGDERGTLRPLTKVTPGGVPTVNVRAAADPSVAFDSMAGYLRGMRRHELEQLAHDLAREVLPLRSGSLYRAEGAS